MPKLVDKNYYERLELTDDADGDAVKKVRRPAPLLRLLRVPVTACARVQAYRKLSRKYHPDKGGSEADFQALGEAHECLKDPFQRMMYDSWLKGDQSEPFNKGGFPDLSEMWAEGEGCMPKVKNAGLVLVLLVVFGLMALYGIVMDWWEYVGEVCAEIKRSTLASFSEEDKEKMLEQMGGEEEIKAQLVLYGMVATFIGWWVGGWTW
jgi:curved DNA-binding protein CbpA